MFDVSGIPLFALADRRLAWIDQRQQLLSQNVANADTPGWRARDLKPFAALLGKPPITLAGTEGATLTAGGATDAAGGGDAAGRGCAGRQRRRARQGTAESGGDRHGA